MEFTEVIKNRYSCKKYAERQISDEQLTAILEAGRLAPTAKNLQEQHIYVARSAEALAKIDAVTPCRYGAPTVLIVAYNADDVYTYPGGVYSYNAGVDSCWLNRFDPDRLAKDLNLPENEKIVMLLDLGYAAEGAGPLPNHGNRKPLEETVSYI